MAMDRDPKRLRGYEVEAKIKAQIEVEIESSLVVEDDSYETVRKFSPRATVSVAEVKLPIDIVAYIPTRIIGSVRFVCRNEESGCKKCRCFGACPTGDVVKYEARLCYAKKEEQYKLEYAILT